MFLQHTMVAQPVDAVKSLIAFHAPLHRSLLVLAESLCYNIQAMCGNEAVARDKENHEQTGTADSDPQFCH